MTKAPRELLRSLFDAAVASAQPSVCVPPFLPKDVKGKLVVIGAGKASAAMAKAVEDAYEGELEGLVVTRYGYGADCKKIEILEAAHPVPDEAGLNASKRLMEYVSGLTEDDTVLCLISGGGSALLPLPAEGISLADKQAVNRKLLACGATINEMNCVRRHLSRIKGGRLAAAIHPARIINLLISDVPGDDPINIASGPTVQDTTSVEDALAIIERYNIELPKSAREHLDRQRGAAKACAVALDVAGRSKSGFEGGAREVLEDCASQASRPFSLKGVNIETHMVAAPQLALEAAAKLCEAEGIPAYILGDSIEGEASDVGVVMAGIARQVEKCGQPFKAPCVLLSGGETTVTLKGNGRGGRNVEFLLSLAVALDGQKGVYALAGDTDGVDGIEEIAGAYCDPTTLARAWEKGINPREALTNNDGHGFFEAIGDSVITGPTRTNVNDFRAIYISGE